mgnify:CR=1 FL=1
MSDERHNDLVNRQAQLYAKNDQFLFHTFLHFWSTGALVLDGTLALGLPLSITADRANPVPSFFFYPNAAVQPEP